MQQIIQEASALVMFLYWVIKLRQVFPLIGPPFVFHQKSCIENLY